MSTNIFERLREERERLGKTQEEFAAVAGVTRRPYVEWEKGTGPSPSAQNLAAMAAAGADVLYILTGQRSQPVPATAGLSHRAAALLDNYKHTDEAGKKIIEGTASLAAQSKAKGKAA